MKILITNLDLERFGGTQHFVRELAEGLLHFGLTPIAFTNGRRGPAGVLSGSGIEVVTDIAALGTRPDIIHGQHHLDAMSAITGLPGVPAIYHCHGATVAEMQPRHPRIYRYVAMSPTLKQRMAIESGIPELRIDVLLNPIDLKRFAEMRTPPGRPRRGLIYNNFCAFGTPTVSAIQEAAACAGLGLDFIGRKFGRKIDSPEAILPEYDVVFASGRSAMEAIACGCATIVLSRTSCGAMVHMENYEQLRLANFTIPINSPPPRGRRILAALAGYSDADCGAVSRRLRSESGLHPFIGRLVAIYRSVVAEHAEAAPAGAQDESRATVHYLRRLTPLIGTAERWHVDGTHRAVSRADAYHSVSALVAPLPSRRKTR